MAGRALAAAAVVALLGSVGPAAAGDAECRSSFFVFPSARQVQQQLGEGGGAGKRACSTCNRCVQAPHHRRPRRLLDSQHPRERQDLLPVRDGVQQGAVGTCSAAAAAARGTAPQRHLPAAHACTPRRPPRQRRKKGFASAGSTRAASLSTLAGPAALDLPTHRSCVDRSRCYAFVGVECVPEGAQPCKADAGGNIGQRNTGGWGAWGGGGGGRGACGGGGFEPLPLTPASLAARNPRRPRSTYAGWLNWGSDNEGNSNIGASAGRGGRVR